MEKIAWDGPKWGREVIFPANPDLADILGRTDLDIFYFYIYWIPNFWISRFQISKIWPLAGFGPCLSHLDLLEHSRTTKCGRSKELGQYRENPISASPVWGNDR